MPRPPVNRRPSPRIVALLVAGAGLAALTGCDVVENADVERGRQLFTGPKAQCSGCHQLAEAGSPGGVGPSLDSAFAEARASGMDSDTVEGIVEAQMQNPRPASPDETRVYMPSADELGLSDDDIRDIAAYVASVAGTGIKAPPFTPEGFFAQSCASCHTLQAAGAAGTTGPNLDEVLPGQSPKEVQASIEDPAAQISPGFDNAMPPGLATGLTREQFQQFIDYLLQSAGK